MPRYITPANGLTKQQKDFYSGLQFRSTAVETFSSSYMAGEYIEYQDGPKSRFAMIYGFRDYSSKAKEPGTICEVHLLRSAEYVAEKVGQEAYTNHRSKAIFNKHSDLLLPDRELFMTERKDYITDRQLDAARKVNVIDPDNFVRQFTQTTKRRPFDKELKLSKHPDRADMGEWFYCSHKLFKVAQRQSDGGDYYLLQKQLLPSNTTSPDLDSVVITCHNQQIMHHLIRIRKFFMSLHSPYTDSQYKPAVPVRITQRQTLLNTATGEQIVRTVEFDDFQPGGLKATAMHLPAHVARELLVEALGEPQRSANGSIWRWVGGKQLENRQAVDELGGGNWHEMSYPNLPGKPTSKVTHDQFVTSFVIQYSSKTERLFVVLDRERTFDGDVVTYTVPEDAPEVGVVTVLGPDSEELGRIKVHSNMSMYSFRGTKVALFRRPESIIVPPDAPHPFWWFCCHFDGVDPSEERELKVWPRFKDEPIRIIPLPSVGEAAGGSGTAAEIAAAGSSPQAPASQSTPPSAHSAPSSNLLHQTQPGAPATAGGILPSLTQPSAPHPPAANAPAAPAASLLPQTHPATPAIAGDILPSPTQPPAPPPPAAYPPAAAPAAHLLPQTQPATLATASGILSSPSQPSHPSQPTATTTPVADGAATQPPAPTTTRSSLSSMITSLLSLLPSSAPHPPAPTPTVPVSTLPTANVGIPPANVHAPAASNNPPAANENQVTARKPAFTFDGGREGDDSDAWALSDPEGDTSDDEDMPNASTLLQSSVISSPISSARHRADHHHTPTTTASPRTTRRTRTQARGQQLSLRSSKSDTASQSLPSHSKRATPQKRTANCVGSVDDPTPQSKRRHD